jgi:hypothetical protein
MSIHCFVERFIADLQVLEPNGEKGQATKTPGPKWIPPPQGLAKINVDAAVSKNHPSAAIAAVARDSEGSFFGASSVLQGISDPETLEAMACREGLALASDLFLQRIASM